MPEASPADAPTGREPEGREGQEPDAGSADAPQEGHGRTYDETYVRQIRREAHGLRSRLSEVEEQLKERTDADKSEQEKLVERATAAEQRAHDAETRLLRFEVAAERKLDPAAVQFLSGSTREEIEHRAEELAKLLADRDASQPVVSFDGGARPIPVEKGTPEQEHNKLLMEALGRGQRAT